MIRICRVLKMANACKLDTARSGSVNCNRRSGYTLLEMIMALALTVLIAASIAGALQIHLISLKRQQGSIEQTHVARNVLEVLSVDIRAAWQYKPFQTSSTVDVAEAGAEAAEDLGVGGADGGANPGAGADAGGGTGAVGGAAGGTAGGVAEDTSSPIDNVQSSNAPLERPGFYGSQTAIVFDISRLPRLDQYNILVVADGVRDMASDIKTTSYFLDTTGQSSQNELASDTLGGLYRRQLDHSVASYANETGSLNAGKTELLATEVVDLAFRFFDGEEWQNDWDSDEQGGFPIAVEIVIIVDPSRKPGVANYEYGGFDPETMSRHRKVVHLPLAEKLSQEELDAIQAAADAAASGGATSGESDTGAGSSMEAGGGDR